MNFLTLANIKAQARVDSDDEDDLLTIYGESAEEKILSDIGQTYTELIAEYTTVPNAIILAGLMLASTWYKYRENVENLQMYNVPYAYENLIAPYIVHTFPEDDEDDDEEEEDDDEEETTTDETEE